jgi:hypothetical protein
MLFGENTMNPINSAAGVLGAVTQIISSAADAKGAGQAKEAAPAQSADKSSFGEGDSQKAQGEKSGDAKGSGDIMKMLEDFLKSIMKLLGLDKKEEAGGEKPSETNQAAKQAEGGDKSAGKGGAGILGAIGDLLKGIAGLVSGGGAVSKQ